MVGGTIFRRNVICVRFPESWSSTSLASTAVPKTAREKFVLDRAFPLIDDLREISRVLVLNLSGEHGGPKNRKGEVCP